MRKFFVLFFVSCFVCMNSFGDEIILELTPENGGLGQGGGKSPSELVTAILEDEALTLYFSPSTSSQVVITDSQTNTVVYSNSFGVATGQVISVSTLPAGEYELSIYAFGKWWWGEFVIEEE